MAIDIKTKTIYHPYDGGLDLILSSCDDVTHLKEQFSKWLSPDAYGL